MDVDDYRALYATSYQSVPGVQDGGYSFGPQRGWSGAAPTAPTTGVKFKKANPTEKQVIEMAAKDIGVDGVDVAITVWAYTLSATYAWGPRPGDVIIESETERWVVKVVKPAMFGSQYICMCKGSPRNVA